MIAAIGLVVMVVGALLIVLAAIGTMKFPDVYCRAHAVGKAMTLGIMLLLLGYGLRTPDVSWLKLIFILLFQFTTIPVGSHLFSQIAYRKGVRRWTPRQSS